MKERDKTKEQLLREVEELRQQSEEYRLIVDTAYEGIWVFDEHYLTTFANRRTAEMLAYEPEEMTGKSLAFFLFQEDLPDYEEKAERRRQGIAERYERKLRRKDGTTLWALISATPMVDSAGRFQGSFAMFTDISERKEAEQALLESEAKFRSIFENAVEGIFQSTLDGRLITVNPAMARIFGYPSPEEMISGVSSIGHELYANTDDRREFQQLLLDHGFAEGFEAQFHRKDGTLLWGSLKVRAVKDTAGELLYYEGIMEDITARKKAEEDLRRSEEKYRDIFENAVEGIFQVTPEGRYLSVNPALARIHGYSSPQEMIASVTDIARQFYVDPSRRTELMRLIKEEGTVKGFEVMMRRKGGGLHWVSITSHAIRDAGGNVLYHEGTAEDITSRKMGDEELKQLRKTAEGTIQAMSAAAEVHDPGTLGHQKRVSGLATAIAREMGLPHDMIESIRVAGFIHDIGKIAVPAEILSKPEELGDIEYTFVKVHPRSGYNILKDAELPYPVAEMVLQHHERLNGSGYPDGIKGNAIPLEARILAVADVVEGMTSRRPWRPSRGIEEALEEVRKNEGQLYDPNVVDACVKLFTQKGFQFT